MIYNDGMNKSFIVNRKDTHYKPIKASEIAKICLNCTLPAKMCNKMLCDRYNKKLKEIKKK